MKKLLFTFLTLFTMANVQAQGRFEVLPLKNAKLHVYYSNDVMADASYIVEGRDGLVTIETPLFKSGLAEFNNYIEKLGKKVVANIADYHVGGTGDHKVIMAEGMGKFTKEGVYAAMMSGFQKSFGDSMVDLPNGEVEEVAFGSTVKLAGVDFKFTKGTSTDFPGAAILIDSTAYLTHWAPMKSHLNALQIPSRAAVKAELEALSAAEKAGAEYYLGGHGGASDIDGVQFKISYLKTVEKLLGQCSDAASFSAELIKAFPGLPAEDSVAGLAAALYPAK